MIVSLSFIALCFILDLIIGTMLPHSFIPGDIAVTSCLGLSAFVLSQRKMNNLDAFLISVIIGLCYDFFVAHSFLTCTFVFVIIYVLVSFWQYHITDSIFENCLLVFTTIFVKEYLVYFFMSLSQETFMSLSTWLTTRCFLTLLLNSIFVVVIVLLSRLFEDMKLMREKRIRKEESISWWKISSKL